MTGIWYDHTRFNQKTPRRFHRTPNALEDQKVLRLERAFAKIQNRSFRIYVLGREPGCEEINV